jgi:hypothetical protein
MLDVVQLEMSALSLSSVGVGFIFGGGYLGSRGGVGRRSLAVRSVGGHEGPPWGMHRAWGG